MAIDSLNLKYSRYSNFFSKVSQIHKEIKKYKNSTSLAEFTKEDDNEIRRGTSYAVFPELQDDVKQGREVTLQTFRNALDTRGITDTDFQNKILYLILQNRAGIHFAFGNIVNGLFHNDENDFTLIMDRDYTLEMKVNGDNEVTLVFEATWDDYSKDPRLPAITVNIEVNITPDMASISNFNISQTAETPQANAAFKFLEDNQQNILQKLITFLKEIFGFNSELRLESNEDRVNTP